MGDALGAIGRSWRTVFEKLGHEFVEVNFVNPNAADHFNSIVTNQKIEFAYSFVGMGTELVGRTSDGRHVNLWEELGIPVITFFGDSPAYYFDRHVVPGGLFACIYAFPEHYELRKRLPKIHGMLGIAPPSPLDLTNKTSLDFSIKEQGKLLFLKNGNDPQKLLAAWRNALAPPIFEMIAELAAELASNLTTPIGDDIDGLVCRYFLHKRVDVEALPKLRLFFIAQLDDYLRRVKSSTIAESLIDFPIEVHGYNWEHVDFSGKRARLFHGGDFTTSKSLIENSLGILDMSPNTSRAPHERPVRAFGMHTLCLTNDQQYFREQFCQHEEFSFRFEAESIRAKIADVLAHPKRYVELGIAVAETFRERNDPLNFGRFLVEGADAIRLAWEKRPSGLQDFFVWPPEKLA